MKGVPTKRRVTVCLMGITLLLISVLNSNLSSYGSPGEGDLYITDVIQPIQVVWDGRVIVKDKYTVIGAVVMSTFSHSLLCDINVTYDFGTKSHVDGEWLKPGYNRIYVDGPAWSELSRIGAFRWTSTGVDDKIEVELDPYNEIAETDETNNKRGTIPWQVVETRKLKVLFVTVAFPNQEDWALHDFTLQVQRWFMVKTYPIATYPIGSENLIFEQASTWRCDQSYEEIEWEERADWFYVKVVSPISGFSQLLGYDRVVIALHPEDMLFIYGFAGAIACGMGREPENRCPVVIGYYEGWGEGLLWSEYYVVAHEIGHTFYLWHPHDLGPAVFEEIQPYPWGELPYGDYDVLSNTFMSYRGCLPADMWIDKGRYCDDPKTWLAPGYYDHPGDPELPEKCPPRENVELAVGRWRWNLVEQFSEEWVHIRPALQIRGYAFSDGRIRLAVPWYRLPGPHNGSPASSSTSSATSTLSQESQGNYSIVLLDVSHQILNTVPFNVSFRYNYHVDFNTSLQIAETDTIPFMFTIPDNNATRFIQIRNATGHILAEQTVTENPPNVEVTFPNGEVTLRRGSNYTISWDAFDLDGDNLTYTVAYSHDNGESWVPLAYVLNQDSYFWNTSYSAPGTDCLIKVIASDGVNTGEDVSDQTFALLAPDIAVANLSSSKTVVGQGYSSSVKFTIENQGNFTETFNISVYANATTIAKFTGITLTSGTSTTFTSPWNTSGFAKGNYTLRSYAEPVLGEIDISDNNFTDCIVYVGIPGDVDGNHLVEIKDILALAIAYGSYPGHPNYHPNLDVNSDDFIDIKDILTAATNYGQTDP